MSKAKVIYDFSDYSDKDLETDAGTIIEACEDNPHFAFSTNLIADAKSTHKLYTQHLSAAASKDTAAVLQKNQTREKLENVMRKLAMEANAIADGDELKLISTRIPLVVFDNNPKEMDVATGLVVVNSDVFGELLASIDKSKKRDHGSVFSIIEDGENMPEDLNDRKLVFVTGHKAKLSGLKSGKFYWVAAAYKGSDKEKLKFCPPIKIRVL